jgi:hypothetical protein
MSPRHRSTPPPTIENYIDPSKTITLSTIIYITTISIKL